MVSIKYNWAQQQLVDRAKYTDLDMPYYFMNPGLVFVILF